MAILLFAACLQVSARSYSQVTLSETNAPLQKVFREIKRQTGYNFLFNYELLQQAGPVTLRLTNANIQQAVEVAIKGKPLTYEILDKTVIIRQKPDKTPAADAVPPVDVHGIVIDEKGRPAAGVNIMVKGTSKGTMTNEKGEFHLISVDNNATLVFSSVNLESYEIKLNGKTELAIVMKIRASQLEDVSVLVNTGYQQLPKERATGSFVHVDNELINRSVSTNILDRISGVASGLIFTPGLLPGSVSADNKAAISIRGRSTIFSNPNPLIIVDNFPFDGDLSTINPNDVETIDILKDAAAASIWGAYSGNGVIVITSKKGKTNQAIKVSANANITIGDKPDLWYIPTLNSNDYINVEQLLFSKGAFTPLINNTQKYQPLSPVADILNKQQMGMLSVSDATTQINALRTQDYRNDLNRFFYRKMVNQQYAVNLSGGGLNNQYFFSAGFDNNLPNLKYNNYKRVTINGNNTYFLFKQHLEVAVGLSFTQSSENDNDPGFSSAIPYEKLVDANGAALPVSHPYRLGYIDTAGQGKLLDWHYRPLDEARLSDNNTKITNYRLSFSAKYRILPGFTANVLYQYSNGLSAHQNYHSLQTFYARDYINQFTQINFSTGAVSYVVPKGGIADFNNNSYYSNQVRGQLNYSHNWGKDHVLSVIGGAEVKNNTAQNRSYRLYGYNTDLQNAAANIDFLDYFPDYLPGYGYYTINNNVSNLKTINHFISYFYNLAYTFKNRYTFSVSARRDEANIFGVSTNQKGVPLWSVGGKWDINKESFYHISWLPYLKLRITDGYNANSNNNISALTTAVYSPSNNQWGTPNASLQNPPNPSLRWEKINIFNIGVDFGMKNNRLNGVLEYYSKKATDLLGYAPIAPQTGLSQFFGNLADMKGHGIDITLNSQNITTKSFQWLITFLFSYARDRVTKYKFRQSLIGSYIVNSAGTVNPLEGKPVYSIYSYKWAGLDTAGNPQVILDGKVSENYGAIQSSSDLNNLSYSGPALPVYFGSLRNTINWKSFSFSFNITYKLAYYFRNTFITRPAILYSGSANLSGYQDYLSRWQKPGDELKTTVPAFNYPVANTYASDIYAYSDVTVLKGDHIRLQDIQFAYNIPQKVLNKSPFTGARVYAYVNNVAILWRANNIGIDPDAALAGATSLPVPRSYAMGIKVDF